jgi:hypothetical protein
MICPSYFFYGPVDGSGNPLTYDPYWQCYVNLTPTEQSWFITALQNFLFGVYNVTSTSVPVYRLLRPHFIKGREFPVNTIVTEGLELPTNWPPTLAVEPLTTTAVAAFYAAGPRDSNYEDLNQWPGGAGTTPMTYWQQVLTPLSFWKLTGLGAALDWIPANDPIPAKMTILAADNGRILLDDTGQMELLAA